MAVVHGRGGDATVSFAGGLVLATAQVEFALELIMETMDVTSMDDTTYRKRIASWSDWNATITTLEAETWTDDILFGSLGQLNTADLVLTAGAAVGSSIYTAAIGKGILENFSRVLGADDAIQMTLNILGSGIIVRTTV